MGSPICWCASRTRSRCSLRHHRPDDRPALTGRSTMTLLSCLLCVITQAPEYVRSSFVLHEHPRNLVNRDLDGDGLRDLVGVFDRELTVWLQKPGGHFDFAAPDQTIGVSVRAACFEFADLEPDGKTELVMLEEGARVVVYRMNEQRLLVREGEPLVSGL